MIRNIIFDWSGTLVDDFAAVLEATNHVFTLAGVPPMTRDLFRSEFALPFERFYRRFIPAEHIGCIEPWFHEKFASSQHLISELPHARAFVEFCRERKVRTFILSTLHRRHFEAQARQNGFIGLFDKVYVEVMDKREKIHELLAENGLAPGETLFVGDMQHDIETARHGGVHACAVLTGYNRLDQLRASQPELIVEHLGELRDLLTARDFNFPGSREHAPRSTVSTVGALIHNDAGELLMIRTRKWSDLWGIPGGKIKYGETAIEALRREVAEETGLQIADIQFITAQDCIESTEFYRPSHFLLLNYTARAIPPLNVRLNEEAQEFKWISPRDAAGMPLNRPTRILLELVTGRQRGIITIEDIQVSYRVGVPHEERAHPQDLLVCLKLDLDVTRAAGADSVEFTVDYQRVYDRVRTLGTGRSWKLIETVASDIADLVLRDFPVESVTVEVKKFILPGTKHVSVTLQKSRATGISQ